MKFNNLHKEDIAHSSWRSDPWNKMKSATNKIQSKHSLHEGDRTNLHQTPSRTSWEFKTMKEYNKETKVHEQDAQPLRKESFHKVILYHHSSIKVHLKVRDYHFYKLFLDSGIHINKETNMYELQL